jgi:hypothetical protein
LRFERTSHSTPILYSKSSTETLQAAHSAKQYNEKPLARGNPLLLSAQVQLDGS